MKAEFWHKTEEWKLAQTKKSLNFKAAHKSKTIGF